MASSSDVFVAFTGHWPLGRVLFFGAILTAVLLVAPDARAQGVGFQGGGTVDPDQFYVGSHFETPEIAPGLSIRPGIDGGFGDGLKIASITVDVLFKLQIASTWKLYQGGGPVVHIIRYDYFDETDTTGGVTGVFGFEHQSGFYTEFRAQGGGGPNLKFGIGITIHPK